MKRSRLLGRAAVLASIGLLTTGVSFAQDAITERKALMKSNGANAKTGSDMVKGTTPFDAKKAADAMGNVATNAARFPTLFPSGSDSGETRASPKIWEDLAGFRAAAAKLGADATAAQKAAASGADDFKAAFGNLVKNCDSCHEAYRTPRK